MLVFFDDILIYNHNEELHKQRLEEVLEIMKQNELYANRKKCEFGQKQVAYLGHIISAKGVAMDMSNVQSMLEWPYPQNIKELRGILGLTGTTRDL